MLKILIAYAMIERGCAPSCQPKDFVDHEDFETRTSINGIQCWSIVWYDRFLSDDEMYKYQIVRLPERDKKRLVLSPEDRMIEIPINKEMV